MRHSSSWKRCFTPKWNRTQQLGCQTILIVIAAINNCLIVYDTYLKAEFGQYWSFGCRLVIFVNILLVLGAMLDMVYSNSMLSSTAGSLWIFTYMSISFSGIFRYWNHEASSCNITWISGKGRTPFMEENLAFSDQTKQCFVVLSSTALPIGIMMLALTVFIWDVIEENCRRTNIGKLSLQSITFIA